MKGRRIRGYGSVFRLKDRAVWWIQFCRNGKVYRESSRSSDEKVAEKLLKARVAEIGADQLGLRPFVGPAGDHLSVEDLLDDAIDTYCTSRGIGRRDAPRAMFYRRATLLRHFGEMKAIRVDSKEIARFIDARQAEGRKPATINRELEMLRRGLRLAVEARRLSWCPKVPRLEENNVREGFFERDDFEAIASNLHDDAFVDFAWFAFYTGMRKTQTAMLTWSMVDLSGKVLRVPGPLTKNRKPHLMPLVGPLWEIIERRRQNRVIAGENGSIISKWIFHRDGFPVLYKSFFNAWDSARKAAGLPNALFHDMRRTAVRNMVRAGVPEAVAMKISGHRTRSIFDRYNIIDEKDIAAGLTRTFDYIGTSASSGRKIQTIDDVKMMSKLKQTGPK